MANTTNFGWETPDDTDLVKDGAAAMRTLGNSIDASFVDLKGGTTGQILSKNSNTDLDYIWINNDQGDITAVTAGTGISGGGTSGAVTITNSMATEITASGDIIVGTGSGTFDNLPIGTTGQVLTADTTVSPYKVKWATPSSGGMTSLASGNINNSVSLTSISGSYNALYLVLNNYVPSTADTGGVRINNDTTATNYVGVNIRNITGTGATVNAMGAVSFVDICAGSSILSPSTQNQAVVYFPNYANTSAWKIAYSYNGHNNNLSTYTSGTSVVAYRSTSAITRLDFVTAGSSWNTQGTYELFGVK